MMTLLKRLMTAAILITSHTSTAQWGGGWSSISRFRNRHSLYTIPSAEPQPEPWRRPVSSRWSLNTPYNIPSPEPEPEPEPVRILLSKRLTRKTKVQNLMILSTTQPSVLTTQPTVLTTQQISSTVKSVQQSRTLPPTDIFARTSPPNPWDIDTAQFDIVPAVPDEVVSNRRAVSEVLEVSTDGKNLVTNLIVLNQFSPVPAVPNVTSSPKNKLTRQPKNTFGKENKPGKTNEDGKTTNDSENEIVYKKGDCQERCAHTFCDPKEDINISSTCIEKCKFLCN